MLVFFLSKKIRKIVLQNIKLIYFLRNKITIINYHVPNINTSSHSRIKIFVVFLKHEH